MAVRKMRPMPTMRAFWAELRPTASGARLLAGFLRVLVRRLVLAREEVLLEREVLRFVVAGRRLLVPPRVWVCLAIAQMFLNVPIISWKNVKGRRSPLRGLHRPTILLYSGAMKRLQDNGLPYLRFASFPEDGVQQHAVFTRHGGISPAPYHTLNLSVSVADTRDNVYANRSRAYGLYGRDTDSVVHAYLVHGADVAQVTRAEDGTWYPKVDGLITDQPSCALTMNYADCAPIFLYDPARRAIGLGHAGWQGAIKDLPGALVRAMHEAFGSQPAELLAAVGPSIGACCYEVGEPVVGQVRASFADPESLLHNNGGPRPHFDLAAANRQRLFDAGVGQIEMSGLCTACRTDLFFSHRAEKGLTGRFGVMLMLT
jgi:polyphenol oxidase